VDSLKQLKEHTELVMVVSRLRHSCTRVGSSLLNSGTVLRRDNMKRPRTASIQMRVAEVTKETP